MGLIAEIPKISKHALAIGGRVGLRRGEIAVAIAARLDRYPHKIFSELTKGAWKGSGDCIPAV